jgi:two-component system sensor histidine kinase QseC
VKLAVSNEQGVVQLALDDSGPGMSSADMDRIGERFFRVVGSGQDGSGLGWSITRRIAAVHRAVVRVARSRSLGGLAVEVDFPAERVA